MAMRNPDPTLRFSSRVTDYVQARPDYPDGLVLRVILKSGLVAANADAVELGAGTGIFTRHIAGRFKSLACVEPNPAMAAELQRMLQPLASTRVTLHPGRAEATGLPDACCDMVWCAQAYHWFEPEATRAELRRILRPGGRVCLVWNCRSSDADDFHREYENLLESLPEYGRVRHRGLGRDELTQRLGRAPELLTGAIEQHLNWDGLRARSASSSYVPGPGQEGHETFFQGLRALFNRHQQQGAIRMVYQTEAWLWNTWRT